MKRTGALNDQSFGYKHLRKSGWVEGQGLGTKRAGNKDPIKVNLKHDTVGLGHDKGSDFTNQWWDHAFNKAAAKVCVDTDGNEVTVRSQSQLSEKQKEKLKMKVLYGNFIKGTTLVPSESILEPDAETISDGLDSPASTQTSSAVTIPTLSDEQLLEACGGRTAHKGARHGFKMNGKLARLEQQDFLVSAGDDQMTPTLGLTHIPSNSTRKKTKTRRSKTDVCEGYCSAIADEKESQQKRRKTEDVNKAVSIASIPSLKELPKQKHTSPQNLKPKKSKKKKYPNEDMRRRSKDDR